MQNNGFDSHMFSYKATKLGAKIEVNGHYAIGTCPVVYSFTFKASKQFEDIFELSFANSGDFSFSCFLGVIVKF